MHAVWAFPLISLSDPLTCDMDNVTNILVLFVALFHG
jgi:uncharacterized protein YhhL (DUF1145 family)